MNGHIYQSSSAAKENKPYNKGFLKGEDSTFFVLPNIDVRNIIGRLLTGLWRIFVFLKYLIHRMLTGSGNGDKIKIPWIKLGIAAVLLFIVLRKDVNFSVNMKAPLSKAVTRTETNKITEFGIASPVSFFSKEEKKAVPAKTPTDKEVKQYVKRFLKVAQVEYRKFGIPVSIKLAQGILESGAGQSRMAKEENNHFGRPFAGKRFQSAWENWRAHSLYLQEHFPTLSAEGADAETWSRALKQAGYSRDSSYDVKLLNIVKKYNLNEYD